MAKISNLTTKIVNAETGEEIERPMNAEELEQLEAIKAVQAAYEVAKAEQAADKAALLARLSV